MVSPDSFYSAHHQQMFLLIQILHFQCVCGAEKSKFLANDLHCPNDKLNFQRYLSNDRHTFSLCFQKHILL